jgi:hypothetical protein
VVQILIEAHYLPSISYFSALSRADRIILERHEYYVKQSLRNRCYINTVHGKQMLTVPVTAKHGKTHITDARIDYRQKWLNNHWRTIQSAYGKAPFFEHYRDDLKGILFRKHQYLFDLNYELLTICLKWLNWGTDLGGSLAYQKSPESPLTDLRNRINVKKSETGNNYHNTVPYKQIFGNKFVAGLSLIDLVFCEGPEAGRMIRGEAGR